MGDVRRMSRSNKNLLTSHERIIALIFLDSTKQSWCIVGGSEYWPSYRDLIESIVSQGGFSEYDADFSLMETTVCIPGRLQRGNSLEENYEPEHIRNIEFVDAGDTI